ncbi:MAG: hypothetical protein DWH99_12045 [Planctomycetota bacterium]|nr:MAG: hypothetical protein DWH99_12045 [Planctomycetota bacterium]
MVHVWISSRCTSNDGFGLGSRFRLRLSRCRLCRFRLSRCRPSRCRPSRCRPSRCRLSRCRLSRCRLSRCRLSRCRLARRRLSRCRLARRRLSRCRLARRRLARRRLARRRLCRRRHYRLAFDIPRVGDLHGGDIDEHIGCNRIFFVLALGQSGTAYIVLCVSISPLDFRYEILFFGEEFRCDGRIIAARFERKGRSAKVGGVGVFGV